jgi:hypothetical protein
VPAHKSLLLRTEVRPAGKLCHCKHNKRHAIRKGEPRLVVKEPGPASAERGYCAACAREMLDEATTKVAGLREMLE